MAAQIPLNDLGGAAYGVLGPAVAGGQNTAALANQLNQPGAVTPYVAAAGPPPALATLAALNLRPPEAARLDERSRWWRSMDHSIQHCSAIRRIYEQC